MGAFGKYNGGSAETISRNGIAVEYGISTLLFEMRGMSDHYAESAVLGQKSNGYLIKQTITTLDATRARDSRPFYRKKGRIASGIHFRSKQIELQNNLIDKMPVGKGNSSTGILFFRFHPS